MGMTADQYLSQLQALLPSGAAWPRHPDSDQTKLLRALAEELARIDRRAEVLLDEADPQTTTELLPDWEAAHGLPDPCTGPLDTLQQRRAAVLAKLTSQGGQSLPFYIQLAKALGYTVTITEFHGVLYAGRGAAGDPVASADNPHLWRINAPAETAQPFCAGSGTAGEALSSWGKELLECAITRLKPAHTTVLFGYGG